jgi:hypothetical protein
MVMLESKSTKKWYGLSTDVKPTTQLVGSVFHETNTGLVWIWNGFNWVEDLTMIYALSQVLEGRI